MFTKALIAAFALIGAQAVKLESSAEVNSTNSAFITTATGSDDNGDLLAQIDASRFREEVEFLRRQNQLQGTSAGSEQLQLQYNPSTDTQSQFIRKETP